MADVRTLAERIARYRDGADPTPTNPGEIPSPGQLWHQLLEADVDQRTAMLAVLLSRSRRPL